MKPSHRSRSRRKIYRRTPSGKVKIIIREKKKKNGRCGICKSKIKFKKNSRILGDICNSCLSTVISYYTKIINNDMKIEDVDLIFRKYVEILLKKH